MRCKTRPQVQRYLEAINCITIIGPTASGKTRLAAAAAFALHTDVISLDSRQVYRGMNIGTGKDLQDYTVNGKQVPVHLIDIAEPGTTYHLHQFIHDFNTVFKKLTEQHKLPVLCGGTALYLHTLLREYQFTSVPVNESLRNELESKSKEELLHIFRQLPATAYTSLADTSTAKRLIRAIEICSWLLHHSLPQNNYPKVLPLCFGMALTAEQRKKNITERLRFRLQNGLIEETETLLASGIEAAQLIRYGLEYKFVTEFLQGKYSYTQLQELLTIAIQQYSRRQMTWWRKMEREGLHIHWMDANLPVSEQLQMLLHELSLHPQLK